MKLLGIELTWKKLIFFTVALIMLYSTILVATADLPGDDLQSGSSEYIKANSSLWNSTNIFQDNKTTEFIIKTQANHINITIKKLFKNFETQKEEIKKDNWLIKPITKITYLKEEKRIYNNLINYTLTYEGKIKKITSTIHKGGYKLVNSGYDFIPVYICKFYAENGTHIKSIKYSQKPIIEKDKIIIPLNITFPKEPFKQIECSDPLVNESYPIIGFVTIDGNSAHESSDLKGNFSSNSIFNFSFYSGIPLDGFDASTYDSVVDVYLIGGDYCGQDRSDFELFNETTKPWSLSCPTIGVKEMGFCGEADKGAGASQNFQNVTGNIWNSSNGYVVGSNAVYDGYLDGMGCNATFYNDIKKENFAGRDDTTSEYFGIALENNTQLRDWTLKNRATMSIASTDRRYPNWIEKTLNATIREFYWLIEPSISSSSSTPTYLNTSLSACYDFDANASDFWTGNHDGSITNAVLSSESVVGNGSYYFDGTGAHITISNHDDFNFSTGNYTIAFWAKGFDEAAASHPTPIGKGDTGSGEWMVRWYNKAQAQIYGDAGDLQLNSNVNSWSNNNTWVFIIATRSGSTMSNISLNNTLASTFDGTNYDLNDATDLMIGGADGDSDRWFKGYIDQVTIWKRYLNTSEQDELWNSGSGRSCSYITGNNAPTTPTNIECDSGSCNNTFSSSVSLNCSGSTDADSDQITYYIEYGNSSVGADILGSVSVRVSADDDDAEEATESPTPDSSKNAGDMELASSDLEITDDNDFNGEQYVMTRFLDVAIPQGASITNAYIEFEVDNIGKDVDGTLNITGEDIDNSLPITTTAFNISYRTQTSSRVEWTVPSSGSENDKKNTSNISSIIQEIVNRSGWVSGNNLSIIFLPSAVTREYESHNGESANAPLLVVNYTTTGATVYSYTLIGNHTEGSSLTWDISSFSNGEVIESFRCNATDLTDQSAYKTIYSNFTISTSSSTPLEVSLVTPADSASLSYTSVEFVSNASDDLYVENASLWYNGSSWHKAETRYNGEVAYNSSGLELLWHMNKESVVNETSTLIYDFSGNGCNGTVTNAGFTDGKFGGSYFFDGVGDYVNYDGTPVTGANSFTMGVWCKNTSFMTDYAGALYMGTDTSANLAWIGIDATTDEFGGGLWGNNQGTGVDPDGEWHHLVMTYNTSHLNIYVDGASKTAWAATPNLIAETTGIGRIGNAGTAYPWVGDVDEAAIWSRALSASEISDLYNFTKSKFYPKFQNITLSGNDYAWNVEACDNSTNCTFAATNYSFTGYTAANSCTWGGSGNWNVVVSDNCSISVDTAVPANYKIVFNASNNKPGTFDVQSGYYVSSDGWELLLPAGAKPSIAIDLRRVYVVT